MNWFIVVSTNIYKLSLFLKGSAFLDDYNPNEYDPFHHSPGGRQGRDTGEEEEEEEENERKTAGIEKQNKEKKKKIEEMEEREEEKGKGIEEVEEGRMKMMMMIGSNKERRGHMRGNCAKQKIKKKMRNQEEEDKQEKDDDDINDGTKKMEGKKEKTRKKLGVFEGFLPTGSKIDDPLHLQQRVSVNVCGCGCGDGCGMGVGWVWDGCGVGVGWV